MQTSNDSATWEGTSFGDAFPPFFCFHSELLVNLLVVLVLVLRSTAASGEPQPAPTANSPPIHRQFTPPIHTANSQSQSRPLLLVAISLMD